MARIMNILMEETHTVIVRMEAVQMQAPDQIRLLMEESLIQDYKR